MKFIMKYILLNLMVCVAYSSHAATSLIDPTRPADYVAPMAVGDSNEQQDSSVKQEEAVEPEIDYRLNAVKIGRTSSLAIINGESVSTGDKLGSARVLRINAHSVDMSANGEKFTITLLPDSIKKHSSE